MPRVSRYCLVFYQADLARGCSGPRELRQSIHTLDDEIKNILIPTGSGLLEVGIDNPIWATRGWTFQEECFSKRRIIFDGDSRRWECSSAIWREHVQLPSHLDRPRAGVIGCESIVKPRIPNLNDIALVLDNYNKRNFTYPEDCLHAFEGISMVLSPQMAGRFVSGLPSAFFDVALLWQLSGKIFRRMEEQRGEPFKLLLG